MQSILSKPQMFGNLLPSQAGGLGPLQMGSLLGGSPRDFSALICNPGSWPGSTDACLSAPGVGHVHLGDIIRNIFVCFVFNLRDGSCGPELPI